MKKLIQAFILLFAANSFSQTAGIPVGSTFEIQLREDIILKKDPDYDQTQRSRSYVFKFGIYRPERNASGIRTLELRADATLRFGIPILAPILPKNMTLQPDGIRCRIQGFADEEEIKLDSNKTLLARVILSKNRGNPTFYGMQQRDLQMILNQGQKTLLLNCLIQDTNPRSDNIAERFLPQDFFHYLKSQLEIESIQAL